MRQRRGFALMVAIWLLIAISGISVEMSVLAHSRSLSTANAIEGLQAEDAAESGVEHARAVLTRAIAQGGDGHRWNDPSSVLDPWQRLDSLIDSTALGTAMYRVSLIDVGTRLNINRAAEDELRRFFEAKGIDALLTDALAQSIMDWRDADDLRRSRGAERDDYLKAGGRELPRNGPFESVEELAFVKGMTPVLFERVRRNLTVLGGGQVDVNTAPREVLVSLPGITPLAADAILGAQRSRRRIDNLQQIADLLPTAARSALQRSTIDLLPRLTFDTHEMEVVSEGWAVGSPVRVRQRALLVRAQDVAFVTWRRID